MKLGFLHLGEPGHGVERYSRMLSAEAARRDDLEVIDAGCALSGDPARDRGELVDAARTLREADVVHIQHTQAVWGRRWSQRAHVGQFLDAYARPVVATLHDVYPTDPWAPWRRRRSPWRRLRRHVRDRLPTNRARILLLRRCAATVVCSDEEAARLRRLWHGARTRVIDHFVEDRPPLPDREAARARLGLQGTKVVTLLGFIHRSKGHELLVRALPHLPPDVRVVFAGAPSPGNEGFLEKLERRAQTLGVRDRLRVTGFLAEAEQAEILATTDLAVAPFRFL